MTEAKNLYTRLVLLVKLLTWDFGSATVASMTDAQVEKCRKRLQQFLADLLEPLGRSERKHWSEVYVRGLLLDGERKSIEPLADRVGDGNVQAMQQLVGQSPSDRIPVWERLAKRMTAELEPDSAWVVDDTGFPKQGEHSVGVERQSTGIVRQSGKLPGCGQRAPRGGARAQHSRLAPVSAGKLDEGSSTSGRGGDSRGFGIPDQVATGAGDY